jgi:hypothetical protein
MDSHVWVFRPGKLQSPELERARTRRSRFILFHISKSRCGPAKLKFRLKRQSRAWQIESWNPLKKMASAVCLLALLGIGIYVYQYFGTPQYSLHKLGEAIHDKDYETARYYVDEDRLSQDISSSVVDVVMKQTQARMNREMAGNPFSGLGEGLTQLMIPQLKIRAQQQIRDTLDGILGKDASLDTNAKGTFFDSSKVSGVRIARVNVVGNTAEVVLDHLPKELPFNLTEFHVRMARIPDSRKWRVVGMPDIAPAFAQMIEPSGAD